MMLRSFFSITALMLFVAGLTGCATVPLPGKGFTTSQSVRPVKPLMEGREGAVSQKSLKSSPNAKPGTQPNAKPGTTSSSSAQSGQTVPDSVVVSKLQEAENKAASARSMSQSAQNADDWTIVAQQWKRALDLLPNPTATSSLSGKVQQARSTYAASLQSAQAQAQSSGKPTAPLEVDRNNSGRRGMILGPEPSASPSPTAKPADKPADKPGDKPAAKPGDKPAEPPKNNPAPSVKN